MEEQKQITIQQVSWANPSSVPVFSVDIHPDGTKFAVAHGETVSMWRFNPATNPAKDSKIYEKYTTSETEFEKLAKLDQKHIKKIQQSLSLECTPIQINFDDFDGTSFVPQFVKGAHQLVTRVQQLFQKSVNCIRFSPDGRYLACCSDDPVVAIFRVEQSHRKDINSTLNITQENQENAFSSGNDLEEWNTYKLFKHHTGDVFCVEWSSDSKFVASCGVDHKIIIYNIATKEVEKTIDTESEDAEYPKGCAFDPIGRYFVVQSEKSLTVYSTTTWSVVGKEKNIFVHSLGNAQFLRLAWSPDGGFFAAPNAVIERKHQLTLFTRPAASFSEFLGGSNARLEQKCKTCPENCAICVAKVCPRVLRRNSNSYCGLIGCGSQDSSFLLFASDSDKPLFHLKNLSLNSHISDIAWSRDGHHILIGTGRGNIIYLGIKEIFENKNSNLNFVSDEEFKKVMNDIYGIDFAQISGSAATGADSNSTSNFGMRSLYTGQNESDSQSMPERPLLEAFQTPMKSGNSPLVPKVTILPTPLNSKMMSNPENSKKNDFSEFQKPKDKNEEKKVSDLMSRGLSKNAEKKTEKKTENLDSQNFATPQPGKVQKITPIALSTPPLKNNNFFEKISEKNTFLNENNPFSAPENNSPKISVSAPNAGSSENARQNLLKENSFSANSSKRNREEFESSASHSALNPQASAPVQKKRKIETGNLVFFTKKGILEWNGSIFKLKVQPSEKEKEKEINFFFPYPPDDVVVSDFFFAVTSFGNRISFFSETGNRIFPELALDAEMLQISCCGKYFGCVTATNEVHVWNIFEKKKTVDAASLPSTETSTIPVDNFFISDEGVPFVTLGGNSNNNQTMGNIKTETFCFDFDLQSWLCVAKNENFLSPFNSISMQPYNGKILESTANLRSFLSKAFNQQLIADEIQNNLNLNLNKSQIESLHIANELEYNLVSSISLGDKQSFERFLKAFVTELAINENETKILGLVSFFMNNFQRIETNQDPNSIFDDKQEKKAAEEEYIGNLKGIKKDDVIKIIRNVCGQYKKLVRTTQIIETFLSQ